MTKISRIVSRHGVFVDMLNHAEPVDLSYWDDLEPRDAPHRVEIYRIVPDLPAAGYIVLNRMGVISAQCRNEQAAKSLCDWLNVHRARDGPFTVQATYRG